MRISKTKVKIVSLLVVAVLACAATVYASSAEGGSLSPAKLKDLGWRAMNFIALAIILVKFLGKPIGNAMGSRRMAIVNQFEELNERRSDVEKSYREYEAKIGQIDTEVATILEAAKAQAETEKSKIIADATRAAEDIKKKAQMSIQHETSMARKKLRTEVAEQAAVMAEAIIRKNLTADDQAKLVEDYLDKVGTV
nr:F0F1 ATP synthase subunit B [Desulfobulbaceae bacterium]